MFTINHNSSSYLFTLATIRKACDFCAITLQPDDEQWAVVLLHFIAPKIYRGLDVDFEDIAEQTLSHGKHYSTASLPEKWQDFGPYLCTQAGNGGSITVDEFRKFFYKAAVSLVEDLETDFYEGEAFGIEYYYCNRGSKTALDPNNDWRSNQAFALCFTSMSADKLRECCDEKVAEYIEENWLEECPAQYREFIDQDKVAKELFQPGEEEKWLGEKHHITLRKKIFLVYEDTAPV